MLKRLELTNVGPSQDLGPIDFGRRLNLITGDNGLGKSFLLDAAWFMLTKTWPKKINPELNSGEMILPRSRKGESCIKGYLFDEDEYDLQFEDGFKFYNLTEVWGVNGGVLPDFADHDSVLKNITADSLVLYSLPENEFCLYDFRKTSILESSGFFRKPKPDPLIFSNKQVWSGVRDVVGKTKCNGLISDWVNWQTAQSEWFKLLSKVLENLSPSINDIITPGKPQRVSLNDVRDIPTILMPYGDQVSVIHASSGMKRILSLAYLMVWLWSEHMQVCKLLDESPLRKFVFLIDEIEAHLHPRWQRQILAALMEVAKELDPNLDVQIIATTHSPLVMSSAEPLFDPEQDKWLDFELVDGKVELRRPEFEHRGDAGKWLISDAFNLKSSRALPYEALIEQAQEVMKQPNPNRQEVADLNTKLLDALSAKDVFLQNWSYVCQSKGWLT